MRSESTIADVTVVGGGLAGVCAAIAAARQGASVNLVHNRPVLGGNSSSEVRVWVCGATAHGVQQYARETGIMGELWLENQAVNPDGNPYYWDLVLLEAVRAEPKISLYLNTDVREVDAAGSADARTIRSVTGWMMGSERLITFTSPMFCDCSGDGLVGYLAGADYHTGREPQSVYGESWAPVEPDANTLGSTILFYTKDVGHPVPFVPPSFAIDVTETAIPQHRVITTEMKGCAYWWIEWGGELDVVHDDDRIRDELQGVVYGIWDYIKNSGKFDADTLTLEWIGSLPGKREYRHFVGDHVLTQHDVLGQTEFDDRVAFGGWSIDLHPAGGVYANEPGSKHWHPDGNYHIPLRCLYSRNVTNMWMAGRNVSVSHVAFGSTRVMATCALMGEGVGVAAALAARHGWSPREVANSHTERLKHALVRADAAVLGIPDTDPQNLALTATAAASSTLTRVAIEDPVDTIGLDEGVGMVLPVMPGLDTLDLLVDAQDETDLTVRCYDTDRPQNYLPGKLLRELSIRVPAGEAQWVRLPLHVNPAIPGNVFVAVDANTQVRLHTCDKVEPGLLFFRHRTRRADEPWKEQFREWKLMLQHQSVCLRLGSPTDAYQPTNVIGGHARPYGGPNMWVSQPLSVDPEPWIELRWPGFVDFSEVSIVLDDSLEIDLINLHHHRTEFEAMPGLLRDFLVQAETDSGWRTLTEFHHNRQRHVRHLLSHPVRAQALRLVVSATQGEPHAHVASLRVYA